MPTKKESDQENNGGNATNSTENMSEPSSTASGDVDMASTTSSGSGSNQEGSDAGKSDATNGKTPPPTQINKLKFTGPGTSHLNKERRQSSTRYHSYIT